MTGIAGCARDYDPGEAAVAVTINSSSQSLRKFLDNQLPFKSTIEGNRTTFYIKSFPYQSQNVKKAFQILQESARKNLLTVDLESSASSTKEQESRSPLAFPQEWLKVANKN